MSIEESVKKIAEEKFSECGYVFANWYEADERLNRTACPFIMTLVPVSGSILRKNGRKKNGETLMIGFFDKVPKGASGEDNEKVYNRMRELAEDFIDEVDKSGVFEPLPGEIEYQPWVEKFTDIVTGVVITLNLRMIGGC